jgi:hypothetical protein
MMAVQVVRRAGLLQVRVQQLKGILVAGQVMEMTAPRENHPVLLLVVVVALAAWVRTGLVALVVLVVLVDCFQILPLGEYLVTLLAEVVVEVVALAAQQDQVVEALVVVAMPQVIPE